jgi:hypothetical protein
MIHHLDAMIRELLGRNVGLGLAPDHIGFDPPDESWRARVRSGQKMWLNCYLVEISENRRLRGGPPTRLDTPAGIVSTPAATRMDCHYLISAWSPASPNPPAVDPTIDEHRLLSASLRALFDADPFSANAIYAPGPPPAALTPELAALELPRAVAPPDGFPKLSEFWLSMGANQRQRPVIHFVVTVPIAAMSVPLGPPVSTINLSLSGEATVTLGGVAVCALVPAPGGGPGPVADATVELLTLAGQRRALTQTDARGHFLFPGLVPGTYRIRAAHADFGAQDIILSLPNDRGLCTLLLQ